MSLKTIAAGPKRQTGLVLFFLGALLLFICGCAEKSFQPTPAKSPELTGAWGIKPRVSVRGRMATEEIEGAIPERKKSVRRLESGLDDPPPLPGTVPDRPRDKGPAQPGQGQVISFKDAPLSEVVSVFADMLGMSIVSPPIMKGTVTLHSGGEVRSSEILPLFETILELNNFALVSDDGLFRVVPLNRAKQAPSLPISSADLKGRAGQAGFGMEVFYLSHISADRAMKSLRRFISKNGDITSVQPANVLIVAESRANLRKMRRLISLLDKPITRRVAIRVYNVENVPVKNLAKDLRNIFKAMGISQKPRTGVWAEVVPLADLNSIAVISSVRDVFRRVERWLADLDRQMSDAEEGVFVYHCQSGEASDIAAVLTSLYGKAEKAKTTQKQKKTTTKPAAAAPDNTSRLRSTRASRDTGSSSSTRSLTIQPKEAQREAPTSSVLEDGVRIVVEPNTNTIVVRAPRRKYNQLLNTIRKLDIFPRQVLIEVVIAEVKLDDTNWLGVEWHNFSTTANGNRIDINTPWDEALKLTPSSGLIFTITQADRLKASLRALAEEGKVNIVSAPLLLSSEGQESTINVSLEVPIVTDITTSQDLTNDPDRKVTDRSIEYRDTGIILSVTPRINDSGLVRMQVNQEISAIDQESFGETGTASFSKRAAATSVITTDAQAIVLAGLIQEETRETEAKIPLLGDIPILGYLFKTTKDVKSRTELVITLTPHVIHDMTDAKEILNDLQDELKRVRLSNAWRNRNAAKPDKDKAPAGTMEAGESQ